MITLFALLFNGIVLEMDVKRCVSQMLLLHKNRHFLRIDCFARGMKSFKRKNRRLNGIAFYGKCGTFDVKSVHINRNCFHIHINSLLNIEMGITLHMH